MREISTTYTHLQNFARFHIASELKKYKNNVL